MVKKSELMSPPPFGRDPGVESVKIDAFSGSKRRRGKKKKVATLEPVDSELAPLSSAFPSNEWKDPRSHLEGTSLDMGDMPVNKYLLPPPSELRGMNDVEFANAEQGTWETTMPLGEKRDWNIGALFDTAGMVFPELAPGGSAIASAMKPRPQSHLSAPDLPQLPSLQGRLDDFGNVIPTGSMNADATAYARPKPMSQSLPAQQMGPTQEDMVNRFNTLDDAARLRFIKSAMGIGGGGLGFGAGLGYGLASDDTVYAAPVKEAPQPVAIPRPGVIQR